MVTLVNAVVLSIKKHLAQATAAEMERFSLANQAGRMANSVVPPVLAMSMLRSLPP